MTAQAQTWAPPFPSSRFNMSGGPVTSTPSELHALSTPSEGAEAASQPWNPENPLFWVGAIAGVTFGLMAFSTSVRVGKTTASLNLGSTK